MTALIDAIEAAFIEGREQWRTNDCVDTGPLLDALALRGIEDERGGRIEGVLVEAFLAASHKWGARDWYWQTGEVAETIANRLHAQGYVS